MNWTSIDTWIVVAGILSAVACALPGNFLVLRKMSMMGDAISHAVLPGLAIAFLLTQSRASAAMFIGAVIVGVLTALFTQWINHFGQVEESASMGVVFTTLFAIGLIVIVRAADHVDLDPGCVLYGAIEFAPMDLVRIGAWQVPRVVLTLAGVVLLNLVVVLVFYKELRISAFDPSLATSLGINAQLMHYLLMTLVAVTTVACFESVGSILVIAMLVVPPATAHLLTHRLGAMIGVSVIVAVLCAVGGHLLAIVLPGWIGFPGLGTSTAGMMSVAAGLLFFTAFLFAPRNGLVSRAVHRFMMGISVVQEDLLGLMYRLEESGVNDASVAPEMMHEALGLGPVSRRIAVARLTREGLVRREEGHIHVTAAGRQRARGLVRAHRLWESYLHKHLGIDTRHVHSSAERLEHVTNEAMVESLETGLERPERDPHSRPIPRANETD